VRTDFAYIDDAVSDLCTRELESPTISHEAVKAAATRKIAGFHIHDPAEEKRQVNAAVERRKGAITDFQMQRDQMAAGLTAMGIVPLAVLPTQLWRSLSNAAGLYRFVPDAHGLVGIPPDGLARLGTDNLVGQLEWLAKNDWHRYLATLFPHHASAEVSRTLFSASHAVTFATLVLPDPPADVVATLVKAADAKVPMKVAAVADAVSFKESPSQIAGNYIAEQEAIARRLRDDPIIYTELPHATAILAQFGDFPIERELVDRVVSAEAAMRFFPDLITIRV